MAADLGISIYDLRELEKGRGLHFIPLISMLQQKGLLLEEDWSHD